ncbi:acetamidase [Bacillus lacus]|uniref:Acetamidase n=1 Tax=Metabacillus lacus TaxID=1983721 RepID=A0A7X2IYC2_9BACI|nr:acetamidase/formamidase family protein [Metabacillus lacus]MRX71936.1 acetamidase [Metabacillus lacus]
MKKIHQIEIKDQHLQGSISRNYEPILAVNSGDTVQFTAIDIGWGYSSQQGEEREIFQSRERENFWGHPVLGPIYVNGARPGDVLEVKIDQLTPGWYGWNTAGGKFNWQNEQLELTKKEARLDWLLNREKMTGSSSIGEWGFEVSLKPFLGFLAVSPSEEGVFSTVPPNYWGGNIDCKELTEGSTLYLPVSADGALFTAGDGHARQGDGEISGQAIECPMDDVYLTLNIVRDMELRLPASSTSEGWLTFGFHEDLNTAAASAMNSMVDYISNKFTINRAEAAALASATVDLRITQVVNGVKGVHAVLPFDAVK